jgi:GAF domain-containing protein
LSRINIEVFLQVSSLEPAAAGGQQTGRQMPFYPLPEKESERLKKLRSYNILDSLPEEEYDRVVRLATKLFDVPTAVVSLIERDRQWFKAQIGTTNREVNRNLSFCSHAICQDGVMVIEDASRHPDFSDNPLVKGKPHLRFYAGAPLRASAATISVHWRSSTPSRAFSTMIKRKHFPILPRWSWTALRCAR